MIPKKRPGRKSTKLPESHTINVGEYLTLGDYTTGAMQKYGSFCHWFNRAFAPKKLVQRAVEGELRIYREK
jgi:hypothetical protein